jgi:hypothetical protein
MSFLPTSLKIPTANQQTNPKMDSTRKKTALAAIILSISVPLMGQTDDLPYDSGSTGADGALDVPRTFPELYEFGYAYDRSNDQIVVFGGRRISGNQTRLQTLLYDGTEWVDPDPATFVSARRNMDLVYDRANENVVMFGGLRADSVRLDETWIWDGTDWTQANPANSPSPRYDYHMFWDGANSRVLLYGGDTAEGFVNELWAWDGTNWTELTLTNGPGNASRELDHADIVYDEANNRAILYNEWQLQTWSLDTTTLTWSEIDTSANPNIGWGIQLAYDASRGEIVMAGGANVGGTWVFDNNDWEQQSPESNYRWSYSYGMIYNPDDGLVYRFYGRENTNFSYQETYTWDGTTWDFVVGRHYTIDMAEKADGIWNYTSISVPSSVDVFFTKNEANTPVRWLATDFVEIHGNVIVDGQDAFDNDQSGATAAGGPGGFDGGIGGVRFDVSGSYAGTPGQGPGGGAVPTDPDQDGNGGTYNGTYGNRLIQPLIGGSGGSGATSADTSSGGNGGGGGGAILIASSRDVTINGGVYARGGDGWRQATGSWNGEYGGGGSGGAIRIVADRINGNGTINANGGDSRSDGGVGRIRLEAYYRPIVPNASPTPSATAPTETSGEALDAMLWIANVAGQAVGNNPTGSLITPDVVFTEAGSVTISVDSENIPTGTPVELRITTSGETIELPGDGQADVTTAADGTASFTATVPAGVGTVQAFAEFTVGN